jgi:hypothetical protein
MQPEGSRILPMALWLMRSFLNTWTYGLGAEILVPVGRQEWLLLLLQIDVQVIRFRCLLLLQLWALV